jgi:hypothetical protein
MNRPAKIFPSRTAALRRTCQAVGIIVFGILMGSRADVVDRSQRALIATAAFVTLGVCMQYHRKR